MAGSVLFDAPGPRARARNRVFNVVTALVIALVIWVVYSKLNSKGQLTAAKWEPFLSANLWKTYVLPGVQGTLTAAAVSIVLALALGFVLGVGRLSTHPAIRWPSAVFVEFFRAVPVLIMMIFAYFLYRALRRLPVQAPGAGGRHHRPDALQRRRHRRDRPCRHQRAAPRTVGGRVRAGPELGSDHAAILLPQAVTSMLPVLISQMVVVLKDTAIGYQITFLEMVRQGTQVGSAYGNYIPALIVIAVLMISVNFTLSWFATWLEGRMRRSRRGPSRMHIQPVTKGTFGAGAGGTI